MRHYVLCIPPVNTKGEVESTPINRNTHRCVAAAAAAAAGLHYGSEPGDPAVPFRHLRRLHAAEDEPSTTPETLL
ncbi:hypothetical protein JOB18_017718 [Solea senegalensis]|uniref:Secreted protein n=1 Tax=Solea senegalensis TaxID=28829 RepID=A0AAV6QFA8_SOLSE|nr:hypothetical protein JOB18_017718 [Solea senegalensis]